MAKQISIADVQIKEITLAQNGETLSVSIWYALVDPDGNEIAQKRDLISNDELKDETKRTDISDLISFAKSIIKAREEI